MPTPPTRAGARSHPRARHSQAEDDEEMPEQMLAGCYLTHLDPLRGASLKPELEQFLHSTSNFVVPLSIKRSSSRRLSGSGRDLTGGA